jgi:hypothetical protein
VAAAIAYARAGRLDQARRRIQAAEPIAGMWPGGAWHAAASRRRHQTGSCALQRGRRPVRRTWPPPRP